MGERPRTWQQAERRALVADLVRTQSTLQARSEQLQEILGSRWHRLARSAWRARRRRPPIMALLLGVAAVAMAVFAIVLPADTWALIAGLLGATILAALAAIYTIVVPALHDDVVPLMAGEDSFARSLNGTGATAEQPEVRLVPSPNDGIIVDLERQRWLAAARMPGLEQLRVAAILDEASEACLTPECDLETRFGAADWRERLEARPPHLLLVESAWAGNGRAWLGAVAPHPGSPQVGLPALRDLVEWCRERGIPSAFWNTQDPLAFDRFAEAATLFDHVFTVDADRIDAYRKLPGISAGTVSALPLAAQPRLHNPIAAAGKRFPEAAFAGTFDHTWPRERLDDLLDLLEAAQLFGLVIYERGADTEGEEQSFPPRFLPSVGGRLSYGETAAAYKRHRVFLNANSTAASPTAFSRQVFELLACGTPVLSTPSPGIEDVLGDLVPTAAGPEEATEQLEMLFGDDAYYRDLAVRGRRHVLGAHTYRDRLAELTAAVGFDVPVGIGEETAVLLVAGEAAEVGEAVDSLLDQSVAPNEVLIGLSDGAAAEERNLDRLRERYPGARIRTLSQSRDTPRSRRLRELARLAAAPWVAPIAPTLRYGTHHLRDLIACTRFAEAQVIGFDTAATGAARRYAEAVLPHAALAERELVAARGWPRDEAAMREWFFAGVRIYAGETADSGMAGGVE
jgi:glycosyltransferase involved in cell wall biosynthesis